MKELEREEPECSSDVTNTGHNAHGDSSVIRASHFSAINPTAVKFKNIPFS
jgi:hypothetical protein